MASIRGNFKMERERGRVSSSGAMESTILGSGKREKNMAVDIGNQKMEKPILVNGSMDK